MTIEIGDIVEYIGMRHKSSGPVIGFAIDKDKDFALIKWFKDPNAITIGLNHDATKWMHIAFLHKVSEDIDL